MRTITVKGTGNVSARPDYIILSLNIETLSKTYDRAMSEATERIERLQGAAVDVYKRQVCMACTALIGKAAKKKLDKKVLAVVGAAAFVGAILAVILIARTPMPL